MSNQIVMALDKAEPSNLDRHQTFYSMEETMVYGGWV